MRLTEKNDENYIARQDRANGKIIGNQMCLDKLGELEDAEEQGLLKMLPCRVGDTVYLLWKGKIYERKVNGFSITSNNRLVVHVPDCDMDNATLPVEQFGKILFLSRESALAEMRSTEATQMSR